MTHQGWSMWLISHTRKNQDITTKDYFICNLLVWKISHLFHLFRKKMRFIYNWTGCYVIFSRHPFPTKGSTRWSFEVPSNLSYSMIVQYSKERTITLFSSVDAKLLEKKLLPNSKACISLGSRHTLQASLNQISSLTFAFIFLYFQFLLKQNVFPSL